MTSVYHSPKIPQDLASILSLQVYHDSSVSDVFLGGVEMEVGKLIEMGKDKKGRRDISTIINIHRASTSQKSS